MKRLPRIVLLLVLGLVLRTSSASAGSILYFNDFNLGTDRMAQALSSSAITSSHTVTTATSPTNFATLLTGGNFDLAIFFEQDFSGSDYDAAFAALTAHIAAGRAAIADDWTRNDTHAAPFRADFTGGVNQTSVTVTAPNLLPGVTNPVNLTNPGWGVFSTDLAVLLGGSCAATFAGGQCAIVSANGGRTLFNGFLADTFVDGAEGAALYTSQIQSALNSSSSLTPIPEPTTLVLFSSGLAGALYRRRSQKRQLSA